MKKFFLPLLIVCLLLFASCSSNQGNDKPDEQNKDQIQQVQNDQTSSKKAPVDTQSESSDEALYSVAYLGAHYGDFDTVVTNLEEAGLMEEYPFLYDVTKDRFITLDGSEVYLIVPASENVDIKINEYVMDEATYEIAAGEVKFNKKDGKPVLVRGNISDIFSNILITATEGDVSFEYNPCLSLMDGKLTPSENGGVNDITPYEIIDNMYTESLNTASVISGGWYCQTQDTKGNEVVMMFEFNEDGSAWYGYGAPNSEFYETFSGSWFAHSNSLTLVMYGGPASIDGYEETSGQYDITMVLVWDMTPGGLLITYEDGAALFQNAPDESFLFDPSVG